MNPSLRLLALALLAGAAAASPCHHQAPSAAAVSFAYTVEAALVDQEWADALPIAEHFEDCISTCNGEVLTPAPAKECWGDYTWRCGNISVGTIGAKCSGHYASFHVPEKSMYVAVCEGLGHYFGKWTHTCPATGNTKEYFFGHGCLGTDSVVLKPLEPTPAFSTLDPLVPRDVAAAMRADSDLDRQVEAALAAGLPSRLYEEHSGAKEARCNGFGGVMKAVKWGAAEPSPESYPSTFEELQAAVEAEVGPMDESSLRAMDQPSPSSSSDALSGVASSTDVLSSMIQLARDASEDPQERDVHCSMTCNGNEVWLRGLWPCWGVFEVSCKASGDGDPDLDPDSQDSYEDEFELTAEQEDLSSSSSSLSSSMEGGDEGLAAVLLLLEPLEQEHVSRRRLSMQRIHEVHQTRELEPVIEEVPVQSTDSRARMSEEKEMTFTASCKGLWTGWFGKMCWGASMMHATVDWPGGCMDKVDFCSGKLGIRQHKKDNSVAMGHFCKGQEVSFSASSWTGPDDA